MPRRFSNLEENSNNQVEILNSLNLKIDELVEQVKSLEEFQQKTSIPNELDKIKKSIHLVSKNALRSGKIIVLFLVHNSSAWESLSPVFWAMKRDDRFDPLVVSIDSCLGGGNKHAGEEKVHEWLIKIGVGHIRLGSKEMDEALTVIRAIGPEVIFRQSHWDADVPPAYSISEISFSKVAYISYEMMTLVQNNRLQVGHDPVMDDTFHRNAWRVFCANVYEKQMYQLNSLRSGSNVLITGHPKVEALLSEKKGRDKLKTSRKIIWSPHHSIGKGWFDFGMFDLVAEDMFQWLIECPDIDFVFSPHPSLRRSCDERFKLGYFDEYLDRWTSQANGKLRLDGAYGQLFDESDALITDGISWLMEYQLFDKPTIFLERPDHLPFNEIGEIASRSLIRTTSIDGVRSYLNEYFETGIDIMREERIHVLRELIPHTKPTKQILESIVDELRS